ncbi:YfhO family protein [Jeotgalibaca sp. MA1X17-3]|uniref:YfhO family protein n=1 Tax=Jeotgalibaca sp. MA1X17-3 TaxID=2908211 RepID=UPI001F4499C1|nr:YfhO family protein [Jeotgalibaca sp. MA1X17-3]UJF14894.1 YfhO family protein [Jeotgalibaca sp. MA1X17-3]
MFPSFSKPFSRKMLLFVSFLLPFVIISIIYASIGVYPFGKQTLLTVDLGQQYVDFFSYYRHTLLHEPSALLYSFTKGIGGEMVGLWSYYLTSPFNLILLFTPQRYLPVGVTLLMILKISSASLSFAYLLIKKFEGKGLLVPTFSLAYAMMGFVIANQLNVMWLDGLVFLPLIILGVEKLVDGESGLFYSIMLAIMLFSHYYIGYMICLFVVLYFIFALIKQEKTSEWTVSKKIYHFFSTSLRFAFFSILSATLSAFILLPNFFSLMGGKASYINETVDWSLDYPFLEVLSKFYIGSFNFDQMPSGHPNLFIGTLALVTFLFYFFNQNFSKKERIVSFFITVFFFASMNIKFLNKVWHAFQYPIWYPYRFSFVVCFFLILNGFRSAQKTKSFPLWFACTLLVLQTGSALYVLEKDFDFVIPIQVLATGILLILTLVLLLLRENSYKWMPYVLLLITAVEMSANATIDLTRLSYVKMKPFNDYQLVLDDMLRDIRPDDNEFYRIEKVFQRSKNDSFQANYPSASHFSSTFEREVPQLYGLLGFPDGNGFVSYSTGTLFTDSLFGIRYFGVNNPLSDELKKNYDLYHLYANSTRPDMQQYQLESESLRTNIYENEYALPLVFGVSEDLASVELEKNNPIKNQEDILTAMTNLPESSFYIEESFDSIVTENISDYLGNSKSVNRTYNKSDTNEDAMIELQITPKTDDPYYLVLDSRLKDEEVELSLNDETFRYYTTFRNDQVLNVASHQKNELLNFQFSLLKDSITIRDLKLYRFDLSKFREVITEAKEEGITLSSFSQTKIEGDVKIKNDHSLLMTSIPYSEGWKLSIDGEKVETISALDGFLAAPIKKGIHKIQLNYHVPYLQEGILISIAALFVTTLIIFYHRKSFKKHKK